MLSGSGLALVSDPHATRAPKAPGAQALYPVYTRPGAKSGHWHTDAPLEAQGMLTVLLAATLRDFHFKDLAEPISLRAGGVLVFNSLLCHT